MIENKARVEAIRLLAKEEGYVLIKQEVKGCITCKYDELIVSKHPCNICDEYYSNFEPKE